MATKAASAADPTGVPPTAHVLGGRDLCDGVRLEDTARFRDARWSLDPGRHQAHRSAVVLDFTGLPPAFREVTKELMYSVLADAPYGERLLHLDTVRTCFGNVAYFLHWVRRRKVSRLADLTEADFNAFALHIRRSGSSLATKGRKLKCARMFWTHRSKLYSDRLHLDPGLLSRWTPHNRSGGAAKPNVENATQRVPEQVMAPLLIWALRWIDDFADDVLGAYAEWKPLHANTYAYRKRSDTWFPPGSLDGAQRIVEIYRTQSRPIPAVAGKPNYLHLARETGCNPSALKASVQARKVIEAAVSELGLSSGTYLRAPIRFLLDGRPWRGEFEYAGVEEACRMLQAAAYVVIAYLSGMRDSEVKHLEVGCISRSYRTDGTVHRRRINSRAFKGEDDVRGVDASWVVTEPVERAVRVLERLRDDDRRYLFGNLPPSHHYLHPSSNPVPTSHTTNRSIAYFIDWVNAYCEQNGRTDRIPLVAGRRWPLTTSQFRRTLAWFIAREPGGVIAGAFAYRHASIQMFEGYAGTSESGFRAEVEAEMAVLRTEVAGEMVTTGQYEQLTGPAAAEATKRLDEFARHVVFDGRVITDRKRMQRVLKKHDHRLHFGEFVTCVYNRDRAMCHHTDAGDGPSLPDCLPLKCRNVALTADNRAEIAQHLAELDDLIADSHSWAPYVLSRVRERRDEVAEFLHKHGGM